MEEKRTYTGIPKLDSYLDHNDIQSEKVALENKERRDKRVEEDLKNGIISPSYAAYVKEQNEKLYEKERKHLARNILDGVGSLAKTVIKTADSVGTQPIGDKTVGNKPMFSEMSFKMPDFSNEFSRKRNKK